MSDIRAQSRRDAEFDRLLATSDGLPDGAQLYNAMREAYEMGKRHGREDCPRWHDAPTCAGLWLFVDGADLEDHGFVFLAQVEQVYNPSGIRWVGPIPPDEVKP